ILLRNLGPETGEGAEDLQPAADQHKERDCIDPVAQADDIRMLVDGPCHDHRLIVVRILLAFTLFLNDFDDCTAHFLTSNARRLPNFTTRKPTNSPGLPSSQLSPARA